MYETYLQKAWSNTLHDVTMTDIRKAIAEIQRMDEEHGAFWIGIVEDEETIVEAHKDLTLIAFFAGRPYLFAFIPAAVIESPKNIMRFFALSSMLCSTEEVR